MSQGVFRTRSSVWKSAWSEDIWCALDQGVSEIEVNMIQGWMMMMMLIWIRFHPSFSRKRRSGKNDVKKFDKYAFFQGRLFLHPTFSRCASIPAHCTRLVIQHEFFSRPVIPMEQKYFRGKWRKFQRNPRFLVKLVSIEEWQTPQGRCSVDYLLKDKRCGEERRGDELRRVEAKNQVGVRTWIFLISPNMLLSQRGFAIEKRFGSGRKFARLCPSMWCTQRWRREGERMKNERGWMRLSLLSAWETVKSEWGNNRIRIILNRILVTVEELIGNDAIHFEHDERSVFVSFRGIDYHCFRDRDASSTFFSRLMSSTNNTCISRKTFFSVTVDNMTGSLSRFMQQT